MRDMIRLATARDLIKCLKQTKYKILLLTEAPISELPSSISIMTETMKTFVTQCEGRG